jgi:predicted HAD superfamily Cof-like phosphohydrolase
LADLIYVAVGTAISLGIPIDDVFAEVHRSNMSKTGPDGKAIRRADGKILKGPNYSPADIESLLDLSIRLAK